MAITESAHHPRIGIAVFVYNADGHIAMGQRLDPYTMGHWGLVGGHLEMGESPEDCARRESLEETGLTLENIRFIGLTNDVFAADAHYITLYYAADVKEGVLTNCEPHKFTHWRWCDVNNMPEPLFAPIPRLLTGAFAAQIPGFQP